MEIKHQFGINTQKHIPTDKLKVYAYHLSTSKTFNHQKVCLGGNLANIRSNIFKIQDR